LRYPWVSSSCLSKTKNKTKTRRYMLSFIQCILQDAAPSGYYWPC